jgi:hypothetical protein
VVIESIDSRRSNVFSFAEAQLRREAAADAGSEQARKRRQQAAMARIRRRDALAVPPGYSPPGNFAA